MRKWVKNVGSAAHHRSWRGNDCLSARGGAPKLVFACPGVRCAMAYFYLRSMGFDNVRIIEGGYAEWVNEFKPGKLLQRRAAKKGDQ